MPGRRWSRPAGTGRAASLKTATIAALAIVVAGAAAGRAGADLVLDGDRVVDCRGGAIGEPVRIVGGAVTIRDCRLMAGLEIRNRRVPGHRDLIDASQNHDFVLGMAAYAAYRRGDARWRRLWDGSPQVRLENLTIRPAEGENDTFLIGPYVHGVRATGLTVLPGAATAIYMAGGSWDNHVENSRIRGDVHLDGSFLNVLSGNRIDGWVRTYKNCGETHGDRPGLPVVTPANGNRLIDNNVGGSIHLAARQDRVLDFMACSDVSPYPVDTCAWVLDGWRPTCKPLNEVYWLDYSANNLVRGGRVGGAVIVEDDGNTIDVPGAQVVIGAKMRTRYLDRPVQ